MESGTAFMAINSRMAEGTVLITFRSPAIPAGSTSSTLRTRTNLPPQPRGTKVSKMDTSKQTEVEASTPDNSSAENILRHQQIKATTLLCWIATPLGWPVDPE